MTGSRAATQAILRSLRQSRTPIFLFSSTRVLTFCNQACAAWLGCDAEQLIGQTAVFGSTRDGVVGVVDRLWPSESVAAGEIKQLTIHPQIDGQTQTSSVHLMGLELGDELAVLAFVNLQPEQQAAADNELTRILRECRDGWEQSRGTSHLVGVSSASQRLRRQLEYAAAVMEPVALIGEPGCGQRQAAEYIHLLRDSTRQLPFATTIGHLQSAELMQAAVTNLVQSGMEQGGSFTATLVIEDIEYLPIDAQLELLGFLEIPGFRMNVIGITSVSLVELASHDPPQFDQRLAHLLSTVEVSILPLRERSEDIGVVAQAILEEANHVDGAQVARLSQDVVEALASFSWPRNIDQLEEVMEHALEQCRDGVVRVRDLPETLAQAFEADAYPPPAAVEVKLDDYLGQVELELIRRALRASKGNRAAAARMLGISRARLLRRLQHFGIDAKPATAAGNTDAKPATAAVNTDAKPVTAAGNTDAKPAPAADKADTKPSAGKTAPDTSLESPAGPATKDSSADAAFASPSSPDGDDEMIEFMGADDDV